MSLRRARRPHAGRARRGLRTTAVAVTAMAALTASRAPGLPGDAEDAHAAPPAGDARPPAAGGPYAEPAPPGDGSYHTELPPLRTPGAAPASPALVRGVRSQSGIPATVLRAYRAAEASVGRTDPGCRLPWELLAAIGKVESGQARGGAVDRNGTTLGRITGPPLDGRGFALIRDTDGGAHDGDTVYDRAVGPMQFLPSTWARWGTDGNGDGRADPNNVFDAALAAGHYLCAGDRDLGRPRTGSVRPPARRRRRCSGRRGRRRCRPCPSGPRWTAGTASGPPPGRRPCHRRGRPRPCPGSRRNHVRRGPGR
ncbi:hypothetical protein GCM10019016_040760 [Streptomyces prasinosporus]|uniref:Transglycosylase SLT domain-containing protein n=1 Tax=Streptomyces prasinosporus TaxID=68256 RepID=A0ABP6TNU1_9ACTN